MRTEDCGSFTDTLEDVLNCSILAKMLKEFRKIAELNEIFSSKQVNGDDDDNDDDDDDDDDELFLWYG